MLSITSSPLLYCAAQAQALLQLHHPVRCHVRPISHCFKSRNTQGKINEAFNAHFQVAGWQSVQSNNLRLKLRPEFQSHTRVNGIARRHRKLHAWAASRSRRLPVAFRDGSFAAPYKRLTSETSYNNSARLHDGGSLIDLSVWWRSIRRRRICVDCSPAQRPQEPWMASCCSYTTCIVTRNHTPSCGVAAWQGRWRREVNALNPPVGSFLSVASVAGLAGRIH